ncbi:ATP-binding cassette domain-containing protein [Haploplasma modicum]|uniref:ABC transporter ATP-binding protein n=2 Tax=Haploplasma modicum TaxID=2150 RepID=UPI00214CDBB3|nr:ATP-binding cassette domain-containing protein [Haploplasma modicum]MCR1809316.1 ATP-binding cassette domain-containing protein [Haploplasma modicum]
MDNILVIENLVKSYGEVRAVDDISFSVRRGSLFSFLGPNGAGKSTTINIIATLLKKDSGKVILDNLEDDNLFRNKIGVVFQNNILDDLLTVKENLLYRGSLYGLTKTETINRYNELKDYLKLSEFENRRFKSLSGGQKRRTEIARALFSNPLILLLDEPTTGLDPETRLLVWKVIEDLRVNKGITIFLTTHYMEEASNSDYVVIIDKGKIVASGSPSALKSEYSYDRLKVVPKDKELLVKYFNENKISYKKISDEYIIKVTDVGNTINLLDNIKNNIKQFEVIKGSMDDVFINVIGEKNE